jgi:hypothetical protein
MAECGRSPTLEVARPRHSLRAAPRHDTRTDPRLAGPGALARTGARPRAHLAGDDRRARAVRVIRIHRACRATGLRHPHPGRHQSGQRQLCRARHRTGQQAWGATHRDRDGYARRPGQIDARHHPGHHRVARAGCYIRLSRRRAGRQRGHLHPLRQPYRRNGARHQPGRGQPRRDRHWRPETGSGSGTRIGTIQRSGGRGHDDTQADA